MESKKDFNIDLITIDNKSPAIGIVALHASLFHKTIISTQEDDSESGDPDNMNGKT